MSELDQYDYQLPRHLVAQFPVPNRADARLLVVERSSGTRAHRHVRDLVEILLPGDCLVLNDTKVIPARLVGRRTQTGGRWEGLFLEATPEGLWRVMARTRGRPQPGETITLINARGCEDIKLRLGTRLADGVWVVRPESDEPAPSILDRVGRVPLPPYIRGGEMVEADRRDYQTVYARNPGSVAAPTAGLHLTELLLRQLHQRGVGLGWVTLHIGPGTFRPVATQTLAEHRMEPEWAQLTQETAERITAARQRGGRVVAVGTSTLRVLETAALDGTLKPFAGKTDLFIYPPYQFRAVDALMTNFHLPRTSLLALVRAFGGNDLIKRAYEEAIREEYRFFSYGDAMLIL